MGKLIIPLKKANYNRMNLVFIILNQIFIIINIKPCRLNYIL
jgi:hypothetical protein